MAKMKKNKYRNIRELPEKDGKVIRGFNLPAPLYALCMAELKTTKYFKRNLESMLEYGEDILQRYEALIVDKESLQRKLRAVNEAFKQIPSQYHEALKYMLYTADTEEKQRMKLVEKYGLEIKEAKAWLKKLVYFYADAAGYPVPHNGKAYEFDINEDGKCVICYYN